MLIYGQPGQPFRQQGVPLLYLIVGDGNSDGLFGANQHEYLLGPGHAGIEKVLLQHHVVLHGEGRHYDGHW